MNTRKTLALAALAASVALTVTSVMPASAAPNTSLNRGRYTALGDSFAAGVGNTPLPNAGDSLRSADSYPVYLAGSVKQVTFLASSGATTLDVLNEQVPNIPGGARQITVTVGGNDLLFAQVALACAADINAPSCAQAIEASDDAQTQLPTRLATLLSAIRAQAPHATVYVTGYPRLFEPDTTALAQGLTAYLSGDPTTAAAYLAQVCSPLGVSGVVNPVDPEGALLVQGTFDPRALLAADEASDDLNAVIETVVTVAGAVDQNIEFVAVDDTFASHGVCAADSADTWIYAPTFIAPGVPSPSSLHPNVAGQHAYAEAILDAGFVN